MRSQREVLPSLHRDYTHAVVSFLADDGYPMSVATGFRVSPEEGVVILDDVAGEEARPPQGREVNVVFSHIRPQPGIGYDERRYVSLWGVVRRSPRGELVFTPERIQGWDEQEMTFFEFAERGVPQAHRYMARLSDETGRTVRPKLSRGWLFLRATRLPFLTATVVPVALGIAVAALRDSFHLGWALLTLLAAAFVQLGLNVANDVFDTLSGADGANVTPTQFSGGSRVIHYGLVSLRNMAVMSAAFYTGAIGIGLWLAAARGFWPLFWIGAVGVAISVAYTAAPFRLVHRGLGEVAVALGFGPIMTLGAFYVQAQRLTWEAFYVSLPVGILIALVLYVNEVPDRAGDAAAAKRTLPVRFGVQAIIRGYEISVAAVFALIAAGALSGLLAAPAIIGLASIPMAVLVSKGLRAHYESPYELMPTMGKNIQLHLLTGLLLVAGYVIAVVASHAMASPPLFLR